MRNLMSTLILSFLVAGPAAAAANPTQKDAVAMAERADAFLKSDGKDKLIEKVNAKDPRFFDGEMYVIVLDPKGTHLAHPTNPKLIGKSMLDVPDPDGKLFRKERVDLAAAKGKGWVDYRYKNPESGKIEQKSAYVLKSGDLILTVGIYK
jgi:cytochrome c